MIDRARRLVELVEAACTDDLDALCYACDAAERLAHDLGQRIQAVVAAEDREARRASQGTAGEAKAGRVILPARASGVW